MQQPTLHPTSQKQLDMYLSDLPQALIVTGKQGTGTLDVARYIATNSGAPEDIIVPKKRAKDGNRFEVDIENGRVLTEDIRALYDSVRGKQTSPRVFIIRSADRMMPAAQHALLKLLEEPATNIYFILETHNAEQLFPTVRSRAQTLTILPLDAQQTDDYIKQLGVTDPKKQVQLRYIAAGLPVTLARLVNDEQYFNDNAALINDARNLLQADTYQRLLVVQKYHNDREKALQLIDSALQIARHSVSAQPQHGLIVQLHRLLAAKENIMSNHNVRLQLAQFVL